MKGKMRDQLSAVKHVEMNSGFEVPAGHSVSDQNTGFSEAQ